MILPRVKSVRESNRTVELPSTVTVRTNGCAFAEKATRALSYLLREYEWKTADAPAWLTYHREENSPYPAEGYRIDLGPVGIEIYYSDARGAVNAAMTLVSMVRGGELCEGSIQDSPDYSYRSFMLDLSRGTPTLAFVKTAITTAAIAKYNRCHLHLNDAEGFGYHSDVLPKVDGRFGRQYSKAEMREIVELCALFEIEIVPEIEIPAHAVAMVEAYPELQCRTENGEGFGSRWVLCPGVDEVWDVYRRLVGEIVEMIPCKTVHMGGDELDFRDAPQINQLCYWDECAGCRRLREREHLKNSVEEYEYVARKMYEIVTSYGKRMMMWNDQIDVSKPVNLPKDILIQYWRIAGKKRGPREGCTPAKFAEQGFRMVNADFPNTYVDSQNYLTPGKLNRWTPADPNLFGKEQQAAVMGGETCAWECGNEEEYPFYRYTLPACLLLFADRLWNRNAVDYDEEYQMSFYRNLFGVGLQKNLSRVFGSMIPPRRARELSFLRSEEIDREALQHCLDDLSRQNAFHYSDLCQTYCELLEKLK